MTTRKLTTPARDLRRGADKATKAEIEADRLDQIIRLRSARTPWRDVARQVGWSHERCRQVLLEEMARRAAVNGENLDRHREEIAETLDLLLRVAVRDAVQGDDPTARAQAGRTALTALRQWADLYGLNAPKRIQAEVEGMVEYTLSLGGASVEDVDDDPEG